MKLQLHRYTIGISWLKNFPKYIIRKACALSICWAGTLAFLFNYVPIRCFTLCAYYTTQDPVFVSVTNGDALVHKAAK